MKYFMPTQVRSERGCVAEYGSEWTALGKKALIVTGKSSAQNGALEDAVSTLKKNHIDYCIFDKTEENPSVEMIMKVRDLGISEQADFVIGIGGGSPMDAAKAIALMIYQKEKDADYLFQSGDDTALPVVEIPTTCGTGSEVTPYSILTRHEKRTKSGISHRIFPVYALLDGKYLAGAGRSIIVHTAVDALGHFIESYINTNASPFSRMICSCGMETWSSMKHVLIGGEASLEDYDTLLLASAMAGMAIAQTGTALPHALSYYFTYENHIPHGKAVGYFLPGYLSHADTKLQKEVLKCIGFPDYQYFNSFMQSLIGTLDAEQELIDRAVMQTLENKEKLKNVPFAVTEQMLYNICDNARK